MINAVHTLIYSDDPSATRAFLRDVLQLPFVGGDEWPIYATGPSELGVHPTSGPDGSGGSYSMESHHEIALMCDDIEATVAELRSRGAEFAGDVQDMGWGTGVSVLVPGASAMLVYQPRHEIAHTR